MLGPAASASRENLLEMQKASSQPAPTESETLQSGAQQYVLTSLTDDSDDPESWDLSEATQQH